MNLTKVKGEEVVRMGIVDSAAVSEESVVEAVVQLGDRLAERKWNGDVHVEIRRVCILSFVVCLDWFRKPL